MQSKPRVATAFKAPFQIDAVPMVTARVRQALVEVLTHALVEMVASRTEAFVASFCIEAFPQTARVLVFRAFVGVNAEAAL